MKIAIIGYGKMGKTIEKIAKSRGHQISLVIKKNNFNDLNVENKKIIDVIIDFSTPDSAKKNILKAIDCSIPIVSGTTGWMDQYQNVLSYCKKNKGSFLYASNFSLGVNLFFELNKKLAKIMKNQNQYEVDIHETHHSEKLDSPSGTAISLSKQISQQNNSTLSSNMNRQMNNKFIKISSERKNNVTGTHIINYRSKIDRITIEHEAFNRDGFALGAVIAAEWILNKTGHYTFHDVLFSK